PNDTGEQPRAVARQQQSSTWLLLASLGAALLVSQAVITPRTLSAGPQVATSSGAAIAQSPKPVAATPKPSGQAAGPAPGEAAKYQAWVKQYCVGCHNTRTPQPANDPVNLETASLDDLRARATPWEQVFRQLW